MEFIANNWYWIVCIIVFICGGTLSVLKFCAKSKAERYKIIRAWLLQAVLLAEKEFGSGTGRLKLSAVYDKFCERFPWLTKIVSFEVFSKYVDDALEEMREILSANSAIAAVIEGATQGGVQHD